MDITASCQRSSFEMLSDSHHESEYVRCSAQRIMASYRYTWANLDPNTFRVHGVITRRSPAGKPVFNIPQAIWLYPFIEMNWTTAFTPAVEVLAVNILNYEIPDRDYQAHLGVTSRVALELAEPFARDVLLTMPNDGGWITREFVSAWIRGRG